MQSSADVHSVMQASRPAASPKYVTYGVSVEPTTLEQLVRLVMVVVVVVDAQSINRTVPILLFYSE